MEYKIKARSFIKGQQEMVQTMFFFLNMIPILKYCLCVAFIDYVTSHDLHQYYLNSKTYFLKIEITYISCSWLIMHAIRNPLQNENGGKKTGTKLVHIETRIRLYF